MYTFVLAIHNIIRWVVLLLGAWAVYRAASGLLGRRPWAGTDRKAGVFFGASMDSQLLLGLILYIFLSPITKAAFADFGAAMADSGTRFFAVEHIFLMLLGVVFVHLGGILSKKAANDSAKHRMALIFYGLTFLLVLMGMPWMRSLLPVF